jgi:hypothetical protein
MLDTIQKALIALGAAAVTIAAVTFAYQEASPGSKDLAACLTLKAMEPDHYNDYLNKSPELKTICGPFNL